jgi:hypothetical protein
MSAEITDELEQALRHIGRLKRTAQMLVDSIEDVEDDLARMARKVGSEDPKRPALGGYQPGPATGSVTERMLSVLADDTRERMAAMPPAVGYSFTDGVTAQAAWVRMMGHRRSLDSREYLAVRRDMILRASELEESERVKLRGAFKQEVDSLLDQQEAQRQSG